MISCVAVVGVFLLSTADFAFADGYSYARQDLWPALCNSVRQSPIDIITEDVQFDDSLIELEMTGWDVGYDGAFYNSGSNIRFVPDAPGQATIRNHLGTYDLLNFHFHWGRRTGEGSGHMTDSDPGELEIHFVNRKQNENDTMVGDYLSVISVIVDVDDDAELTSPWLELNFSRILAVNNSINITGFRFDQLLPNNREYYYYEGSFTSPPCYEIVGWFVMKNRITIPGAYLEQLRMVEFSGEEQLGYNFRMTQDIGDRVVTTIESQAFPVKPVPAFVLMFCMMQGFIAS